MRGPWAERMGGTDREMCQVELLHFRQGGGGNPGHQVSLLDHEDMDAAVTKQRRTAGTYGARRPIHVENMGGDIGAPELQNRRLTLGCFPWLFKGGEAAFCRCVAFVEE